MLIIFRACLFTAGLIIVIIFGFHAFHGFLFLNPVTQDIHQVDDNHILINSLGKSILNPLIGLTAHIDEQITG